MVRIESILKDSISSIKSDVRSLTERYGSVSNMMNHRIEQLEKNYYSLIDKLYGRRE